jgi:hypothetical protein
MKWLEIINEEASGGATCAGNVASVAVPLGALGPGFGGEDKGVYNEDDEKKTKKRTKNPTGLLFRR